MNRFSEEMESFSEWLKPHYLLFLFSVAGAISIILAPLAVPIDVGGFAATLSAINLTANVLTYGIPFTLGAVLMWNTEQMHRNLTRSDTGQIDRVKQFTIRYMASTLISFIYMAAVCCYGFIVANGQQEYLFGVLAAVFFVSLILNAPIFLISIIVDSPKLTFVLSSAIFIFFSYIFGYTQFSATDTVSLYAPYHFFRFLAISLTGYEFASESIMEHFVGLYVEPITLVGPILLWSAIAILSVGGSIYLLRDNVKRWVFELSDLEEGKTDLVNVDTYNKLERSVLRRRQIVAGIIIVLFVSTVPINLARITDTEIPEDLVLYKSPPGGETIMLGAWKFGSVEVTTEQFQQAERWVLQVTILGWGEYSGTDGLDLKYDLAYLTIPEFQDMNETERDEEISKGSIGITPNSPQSGSGSFVLQGTGTILWAIRITDPSQEEASYSILISIDLHLES